MDFHIPSFGIALVVPADFVFFTFCHELSLFAPPTAMLLFITSVLPENTIIETHTLVLSVEFSSEAQT